MSLVAYGITIIDAQSPSIGDGWATFEIRTDVHGGFERYQCQDGYAGAKLRRVSAGVDTPLAQGDAVEPAMNELLQCVHAMEPCKLTYREFQILVDGWVAGRETLNH